MITAAGNCTAPMLASKKGRNIKMFDDTFADDDQYLSAAKNFLNFPKPPPATISDMLNGN